MARLPRFLPSLVWEHMIELPEDTNALAGQVNGKLYHGPGELHWKRGILWRRRVLRWPGRWHCAEARGWDGEKGTWREGTPVGDYDQVRWWRSVGS